MKKILIAVILLVVACTPAPTFKMTENKLMGDLVLQIYEFKNNSNSMLAVEIECKNYIEENPFPQPPHFGFVEPKEKGIVAIYIPASIGASIESPLEPQCQLKKWIRW